MYKFLLSFILFFAFTSFSHADSYGRYAITPNGEYLLDTATGKTWVLGVIPDKDNPTALGIHCWNPVVFSNGKQWTLVPPN